MVTKPKRYRWARRMLPHEYRFMLLFVHRQPRGSEERVEMAKWLKQMRAAKPRVTQTA